MLLTVKVLIYTRMKTRGASERQLALNFTAWSQVRLEAKIGRLVKFRNKTKAIQRLNE